MRLANFHDKMFLQKGYAFNNSITISGSKDKSDFLISVSNNKQNSNFKGNGDYQRSNLTTNLGFELAKNAGPDDCEMCGS